MEIDLSDYSGLLFLGGIIMAIQINGFTITSLEKIHAYDRVSGVCEMLLDELKSTTISNSEDTTDITGKGDRILKQIKKNKSVTVSGESALISGGLMAAQTGSEEEVGDVSIRFPDVIKLSNTTSCTTKFKASGEAGAEIVDLRIMANNGALLPVKYTQTTGDVDETHFKYDAATKTVTLPTDSENIAAGTTIVVFYDFATTGSKVVNRADVFGKTLYLVIDCLATDVCDNEYKCQFVVPRAQFSGTFDIDMGGDQTIQSFEATTLVDTCQTSTTGELFEFIVYQDPV